MSWKCTQHRGISKWGKFKASNMAVHSRNMEEWELLKPWPSLMNQNHMPEEAYHILGRMLECLVCLLPVEASIWAIKLLGGRPTTDQCLCCPVLIYSSSRVSSWWYYCQRQQAIDTFSDLMALSSMSSIEHMADSILQLLVLQSLQVLIQAPETPY